MCYDDNGVIIWIRVWGIAVYENCISEFPYTRILDCEQATKEQRVGHSDA